MGFRILHSISSVNPEGGGPIEGLKQMSAINARHGHVVEVVSLDDPASPWVAACPMPVHALGPAYTQFRYSPRFVPWLRAHHHEYDAVIVNGIWQYASYGVWRALHDLPTPYFVFTHGMLDPWFRRTYPFKHLKKWMFWPWADYRVLRDAAAVLFTCEEERRLARQSFWLYKCDEFVVNYGTSAPPRESQRQRDAFLGRFPEVRDKRVLLFLGRVHPKKGPDLLVRALADVLAGWPADQAAKIHLVMAGPDDQPYAATIKRLAASLGLKSHITWTGMVSGDLKWGAFRVADAFILPSHQENFGIAVAESLACAVPVLISNQVNIWREIRQYDVGYVEPDNLAGTRRLIERWLQTHHSTWQSMAARSPMCFAERFLVDRTAESFIQAMRLFGLARRTPHGLPESSLGEGALGTIATDTSELQ